MSDTGLLIGDAQSVLYIFVIPAAALVIFLTALIRCRRTDQKDIKKRHDLKLVMFLCVIVTLFTSGQYAGWTLLFWFIGRH